MEPDQMVRILVVVLPILAVITLGLFAYVFIDWLAERRETAAKTTNTTSTANNARA